MYAVAIDGPAGAGKSTIAKMAANELAFVYVDTGALYRAVALYMIENNISLDPSSMVQHLDDMKISLKYQDRKQKIFLGDEDVSKKIRKENVSRVASLSVSVIPEIREFLLHLQKKMADKYHVIMDGRDIGTVVLPHADVKIFLTAFIDERAKRRIKQLQIAGQNFDAEKVLKEMQERDYNDANRIISPTIPAKDAIILDTSFLSLQEASDTLITIIKGRLNL